MAEEQQGFVIEKKREPQGAQRYTGETLPLPSAFFESDKLRCTGNYP
jgi:hypothetical protein